MTDVSVGASPVHGLGVFAQRAFAQEETILVIDDTRIVDEDPPLHPELDEFAYHCDYLAQGKVVLMLAPERHINASCDPNSYVKTIAGLRHVVARKPIQPGEEITYDDIINCRGARR